MHGGYAVEVLPVVSRRTWCLDDVATAREHYAAVTALIVASIALIVFYDGLRQLLHQHHRKSKKSRPMFVSLVSSRERGHRATLTCQLLARQVTIRINIRNKLIPAYMTYDRQCVKKDHPSIPDLESHLVVRDLSHRQGPGRNDQPHSGKEHPLKGVYTPKPRAEE